MSNKEIITCRKRQEEITFVQFSDKLLTTDSIMRDYYRKAYSKMDGYYFPEHYMEIPFWIPKIAGKLPDNIYNKSLHIVTNLDQTIDTVKEKKSNNETTLFSVMDANVRQVKTIADKIDKRIVMGGYTDKREFEKYPNITYLDGIQELTKVFEVQMDAPPDYSLFKGEKCIPRLTLSTGCLFRCAFCTVPTTLTVSEPSEIRGQVEALKPLDFKLIFIDDKSFGQASNWSAIGKIREQVKEYNPGFLGFIAQTPPSLAVKPGFMEKATELGLRYLEVGVETVNDEYLKLLNKPYRLKHLEELCNKAREYDLKIIPNFILGIPEDDYKSTIDWVSKNRDIIPVVNINFLAAHHGNERGKFPFQSASVEDRDQNSIQKSWLTQKDLINMNNAMNTIYQITTGVL